MSKSEPWVRLVLVGLAFPLGSKATAGADEGPVVRPSVTIRAVRPDLEVEAVFHLFRGSRVANPAAALVAWKRASREPKRLGKPFEAAIAAINPRMIPEYRLLDAAELAISFVPGRSRPSWWVRFPNDDGTLGALGPTSVLTAGRVEPPIGEVAVDRIGVEGSPLLAHPAKGLVAASDREQLEAALRASQLRSTAPPIDSGWLIKLDPSASETWTSPAGRRWAEAARVTQCQSVSGRVRFAGTSMISSWIGRFGSNTPVVEAIDPDWLDPIPARGPLAAFGFRVDPRPESWGQVFALVDRVERTDPERANVASSRVRLALAARTVGVRLEADVWPHLRGVSGWVGSDEGKVNRGLVAVHLVDEAAALRLMTGLKGRRVVDGPDEVVEMGPVAGQPLRLIRRRASVFVAWGDRGWSESRGAIDHPERSARPWLGPSRTGALPTRVGAVWLDQIPGLTRGAPLTESLSEAPPLRWAGGNEGNRTLDEVWVDGLDATVRRFLDRIPLDPPPSQ